MSLRSTRKVVTGALVLSCCVWFDAGCGGNAQPRQEGYTEDPRGYREAPPRDYSGGPRAPSQQPVIYRGSPEMTRDAVGTGDSDGFGSPTYEAPNLMPNGPRAPGLGRDPEYREVTADDPDFEDIRETDSTPQQRSEGQTPERDRTATPDGSGSVPTAGGPLLKMPLINQRTGGGKYPGAYCGPTSVRMVLAQFGIEAGADEVALGKFGPGTPMYHKGEGSTHEGMATALKHYGLNANLEYSKNLSDLRAAVERGHPVIVNVEGNYGPFYTNGHIMVVVGFSANGDPIVNDPAGGVQRTIPKRRFLNCWQGLAIETWK
ncbi:MAG: C39 family peptidase [Candidatus Wallbacteria bacterium]|nr:C39 family peptidase [Candidatus Wallbacteria bacterium]